MPKLLIPLVVLAFLLRVIFSSSYPTGFTPDEASFGYDAYSLLKTGKDQWGQVWPLTFRSFGDFKLPLYGYLTIPSVAILGLNEFAVRLPSASFGTLAVLVVYLLARKTFGRESVALLSALTLTLSPWHISLSRGAFEANLTTFFMPLGVWAFLKGLKKPKWMLAAAFAFGVNLFTYHSARLVTPLIVVFLIIIYRDKVFSLLHSDEKNFRIATAIFLASLFIVGYTIMVGGSARGSDIAIFNPTDKWAAVADRRYEAVQQGLPDFVSRLSSNKFLYVTSSFLSNYLSYFSPQFLFTQGAGEWTYGMISGFGVLYIIELPFLLFTIWSQVKKPDHNLVPIIFWILISPIPAALTKGPGLAASRVAVMMPAIQILSAYGAVRLWTLVKEKFPRYSTKLLLFYSSTLLLSMLFFLENYIYHAPKDLARGMLYGRREALQFISRIQNKYPEIIVSRSLSEPQIYVAFYEKFNPGQYQQNSKDWVRYEKEGRSFVDQLGEYRLGKYAFREINFSKDKERKDVLLVGQPKEFPEKIVSLKTVNYPDGKSAILIVDPAASQLAHQ